MVNDLTLSQFIDARKQYCQMKHEQNGAKNCSNCCAFILFANDVLKDGVVELKFAFTKNFPHMKYISSKAVRLLMQLPIIII